MAPNQITDNLQTPVTIGYCNERHSKTTMMLSLFGLLVMILLAVIGWAWIAANSATSRAQAVELQLVDVRATSAAHWAETERRLDNIDRNVEKIAERIGSVGLLPASKP